MHVPPNQELVIQNDLGDQIPKIEDGPWPAFPADLTSIALAVATQAHGTILIFEKMFENRLFFVDKLVSMGARIILCDPHRAVVTGPARLYGQRMASPDIRAGMAMLIAGLCAEGTSTIGNVGEIDRGYERIDERLRALGRTDRARRGLSARLRGMAAAEEDRRRFQARVDVEGSGRAQVATGVPILDHLLGLLADRSGLRRLARGGAGRGDRRGRGSGPRTGGGARAARSTSGTAAATARPSMPADEALAHVSLEYSGRPLLVSNVDLSDARVAGLDTDLVSRFLQELANGAGLTLHVRLIGGDEPEHVLESIFKALGVALAQSCRPRGRG